MTPGKAGDEIAELVGKVARLTERVNDLEKALMRATGTILRLTEHVWPPPQPRLNAIGDFSGCSCFENHTCVICLAKGPKICSPKDEP